MIDNPSSLDAGFRNLTLRFDSSLGYSSLTEIVYIMSQAHAELVFKVKPYHTLSMLDLRVNNQGK